MRGGKLLVLMWKHLMVRKRRFIHTAVELISPLVFFLLLFALRKKLTETSSSYDDNPVKNTEEWSLSDSPPPRVIFFTPDSKLAETLMNEVCSRKLGFRIKTAIPTVEEHKYLQPTGCYAFSNVSDIAEYVYYFSNAAVVTFDDMEADTWEDRQTNKLSYTIRTKNNYDTYSYVAEDGVPKAHHSFGKDLYEEFMKLQWAIDSSYLTVRYGKDPDLTVTFQEFPYYGDKHATSVIMLCAILPPLCIFSLYLVFVFLTSRLLEERTTGIQELIKMVGVSSNTLGISHFLNAVPTGLMYAIFGTVLLKVSSTPLIQNTDGGIIFIAFVLHFVSVAAMAFASSYLAKSTQYTVSIAAFAFIALWVPFRILDSHHPKSRVAVLLCGFFPHVPMAWLWGEVAAFEQYQTGLTFAHIASSHSATTGPVLVGFGWMVAQSALFFFIAWYLSHVRPGHHGQAEPWNFLCQKAYWSKNEVKPESVSDEEEPIARDRKYFEDPPKNMEAGIKIENVSKLFPKNKALNNVSLEVYKGEITVLLGHNGAGKTTLMSIITGMMSATEGKVLVNGMDTVKQRDAVRTQLGLCPQHNLFFADLTVREHAIFFTLLKGVSYAEARSSSTTLLKQLGIEDKANSKSAQLSGGMKRRLQLACALAGGANVLVLDEPTSGLDVETRRQLWDLLLSLRGERTVLLTTHFMEEADALGDRVAALHSGQLRCHATTMHLKKAIGTGYRLSFTTNGVPRDNAITSTVTSFVPDAVLKEKTINSLSYNLPAAGSAHFPNLFTTLEEKKSELGIETIGVGVSTLEEVFLKLCSDTDTTFTEDEVDTASIEPTYNKISGFTLYMRQFGVLFKRQIKYCWAKKESFLFLQAIIPIVMIFLITHFCNDSHVTDTQPKVAMNLDMYAPMPERNVLYDTDDTASNARRSLEKQYPKVDFTVTPNITDVVLRSGMKSALDYNKHLVGIELHDKKAKVMYTTVYRHAAPIALNLLSNTILRELDSATARSIDLHNHPLKGMISLEDNALKTPKGWANAFTWIIFIVFIIQATNINLASLPCAERVSGSRHLHVMAGCPSGLHWLCTLCFHTLLCAALLVTATSIAASTVDTDSTLTQPQMILTLALVLVVGSMAFFAFMYLITFYFTERTTGIMLFGFLIIFGLITPLVKIAFDLFDENVNIVLRMLLTLSAYTIPMHPLTVGAAKCVYVARLNALCTLNKDRCPNLVVDASEIGFDVQKCCGTGKSRDYFAFDNYSPAHEILILIAQFLVYMCIVVLTQEGWFNCISDRLFNMRVRNAAAPPPAGDDIVRAEAVYVSKEIALPKRQIEEAKTAMLVSDVHKTYHRIFGKSCHAVQGVSISVKKGECFGLLGVNGAGKSTTFKMMTAEECPTKGEVYANGHFLKKERGKYLRSLGYCPQFFGLDAFQTGRDNLALLLTLRGLDAHDVTQQVNSWIDVVGLEKYSRRAVSSYSGGCTRRLGAAAALCSGAPLTLLDEPTAGVDVAARRRVWAALRRALRLQRSVLITSHSMDEMEALCSRIGIMSCGAVRALGTPHELRARHAQGHAVLIKVRHDARHAADEVDSAKSEIESFKSALHTKFNCTLKDSHKTMLHYHINETMRYSELFSELERLKEAFPSLVEDYSVTETTLEEVFLSFAKDNPGTEQPTRNGIV